MGKITNILGVLLVGYGLFGMPSQTENWPLLVAVALIFVIILGERSALEQRIEEVGIPGREAVLPMVAIAIAWTLGNISTKLIVDLIVEKGDIVALILSFAAVSNGLSRAGFFEWAAFQIAERCGGSTARLIFYLFVLCSILTVFTSNDIVILVMTPIIFSVAVTSRIKNAKLLFLSQFIAANTLSMFWLIGSPTNIIIGEALGIGFVEYMALMLVPTFITFFATLIVIDRINRSLTSSKNLRSVQALDYDTQKKVSGWSFYSRYQLPPPDKIISLSSKMQHWQYVFALGVVLLLVVTQWPGQSDGRLYWVAVPLFLASAYTAFAEDRVLMGNGKESDLRNSTSVVLSLPYGIIFFAIAFFILAKLISQTALTQETIGALINRAATTGVTWESGGIILASSALTNMVNDLPAAAIFGELLSGSEGLKDANYFSRVVILQSVLVGLNIGCYLTPVGALAGILWFDSMNREKAKARRQSIVVDGSPQSANDAVEIELPTRLDLIKYGGIVFLSVTAISAIMIPSTAVVLDLFTSGPKVSRGNYSGTFQMDNVALPMAGIWFVLLVVFCIFSGRAIRRNQLVLAHLSDVFTILNRVSVFSLKNRGLYIFLVSLLFLTIGGSAIWLAESLHLQLYPDTAKQGQVNLVDGGLLDFASWLVVFVGSSFDDDKFANTYIARWIAGILPFIALAAIVFIVRYTSQDSLAKLKNELASGKIPAYRIVILNYQARFEPMVRRLLQKKHAFVVLVCNNHDSRAAKLLETQLQEDSITSNRTIVMETSEDQLSLLKSIGCSKAQEIYILTDNRRQTELDNLRIVTSLDAEINRNLLFRTGRRQSELEFIGTRIFVETASSRMRDLINRSISIVMERHIYVTNFDDVVCDNVFATISPAISDLRHYLRLDGGPLLSGLERFRIEEVDIAPEHLDSIKEHFSSRILRNNNDLAGRSARKHSSETRSQLDELLSKILYLDESGGRKRVKPGELFGLSSKVGSRKIRIGVASASLSLQAATSDQLLLLKKVDSSDLIQEPPLEPIQKNSGRIFIVNMSVYGTRLVERLLEREVLGFQEVCVISIEGRTKARLVQHELVSYHDTGSVEELAHDLIFDKELSLQQGDAVIIFTDHERTDSSEIENLQLIEALDDRMSKRGKITHDDVFLLVESTSAETRFLFEHLFVDKIIDTSSLRVSLFDALIEIKSQLREQLRKNVSPERFTKVAHEISESMLPFNLRHADEIELFDFEGDPISLVDKSVLNCRRSIKRFSEPPEQVIGVATIDFQLLDNDIDAHLEFVTNEEAYRISPKDWIITVPSL